MWQSHSEPWCNLALPCVGTVVSCKRSHKTGDWSEGQVLSTGPRGWMYPAEHFLSWVSLVTKDSCLEVRDTWVTLPSVNSLHLAFSKVHIDLCVFEVSANIKMATHSCSVHLSFQTLHEQAGK